MRVNAMQSPEQLERVINITAKQRTPICGPERLPTLILLGFPNEYNNLHNCQYAPNPC